MNSTNFMEPHVKQYGSHMLMTNVHRPLKRKYVNIDTKFRDENNYNLVDYNVNENYYFTLPDRIVDVKSMIVCNAEIPVTFYNISASLGNNYFEVVNQETHIPTIITIPDGQYGSIGDLTGTINTMMVDISFTDISFGYTSTHTVITNNTVSSNYCVNFNIGPDGNFDKYNFKSKLGGYLDTGNRHIILQM